MKKRLYIGSGLVLLIGVLAGALFLYLLLHRTVGQFFDSNGVQIHYTVEGNGEPIVLIHGLGVNADLNWRRPGITQKLARQFKVIALDLRGHGLSGKPTKPEQYGAQMAEDVVRLMDHLNIQKAHIAGYSLGGFIVLKLMAAHPDRVLSAAVCASGWRRANDDTPLPNPYKAPKKAESTQVLRAVAFASPGAESLFHRVRNGIEKKLVDKTVVSAIMDSINGLHVTQEEVEANKLPTICFIGTKDGLLSLAEDLRSCMPNLEFVKIDGADHFSTVIYREFQNKLLKFFQKNLTHQEPTGQSK